MNAIDDYFYIGPMLVDRIKCEMPELVGVVSINDTSLLGENSQASPVAHVLYVGDETQSGPASQGGSGKKQVVAQLWAVIIAVYYGQDGPGLNEAQKMAGPLVSRMLRLVSGWKPDEGTQPFKRSRPMPPHYSKGFAYFPFVFRTEFVF